MKVNDQQQDFSGGMVDNLPPDRIPSNAYRFGENVECRNGILRTRRGQAVLDAGVTPGAEGEWTPVGSCKYVSASGVEYVALALVAADGTLQTRLLNPFIDFNNAFAFPEGTDLTPSEIVIDETDAVCIFQYGRRLYLWRPVMEQVFRWDGDTEVLQWAAVPSTYQETGEWCPVAKAACVAFGRVWAATKSEQDYGVYDCVTASDITMMDDAGLTWDIVKHNWQIGAEDHSDIMAMVPHSNGRILIFKRHSVHALNGCEGYIDAVYAERVDAKHGTVGSAAVLKIGDDVWRMADDGIRSVVADKNNNAQGVETPLTHAISNFFAERVYINAIAGFLASSAVFDSYALFTVPYGQTVPNAILAYDLMHGCWAGVWTHIYALQLHVIAYGVKRYLLGIGVNGAVQQILTEDRWEQVDAPTAHVITRAYNCGSTERRKSYRSGLLGLSSGGATFTLGAVDLDTSREKVLASDVPVQSDGWMIYIPDDGLEIPDEGIHIKDIDLVRKTFFVGMQARAMCLSLRVESGAMDIRAIAVEASPGRAMTAF